MPVELTIALIILVYTVSVLMAYNLGRDSGFRESLYYRRGKK